MVTTGDIGNILYRDLADLGLPVFKKGQVLSVPDSGLSEECIRIIPKELKSETYWKKDFVEVNFLVPDVDGGADTKRLTELERISLESVGSYDGSPYSYSIYSTSQEVDTALKCHFVNVKLLFQVLNVKKL